MKNKILNDLMYVNNDNIFKMGNNVYLININSNTYKLKLEPFCITIYEIIYDLPSYKIRLWRGIDPLYSTISNYFKEYLNIYYNSEI